MRGIQDTRRRFEVIADNITLSLHYETCINSHLPRAFSSSFFHLVSQFVNLLDPERARSLRALL